MGRTLGTVTCKGCEQEVAVEYRYSNSDESIGLTDHDMPGEKNRCPHAGLVFKMHGKWLFSALDYYSEEDIRWGS